MTFLELKLCFSLVDRNQSDIFYAFLGVNLKLIKPEIKPEE